MPSFFRNKRLILILVSIIFLVALIGFTIRDRENLTLPEQFLQDTIGWVQTAFHAPVQFVTGTFDNVSDIKNTYEQNKVLKQKLLEDRNLLEDIQLLRKENKELRSMLDKNESLGGYTPIQATVIARGPEERWYKQLTINRGEQHGVQKGMAVITGKGMIGKIQSTSQVTSTIQLLSGFGGSNLIHAKVVGDDNQYGLIEGGYDEEKKALLLKEIPYDAKIEEGQLVVSSGMGGVFPSGLEIGKVREVVIDEYGLTQLAYVEPAADFYEINHVSVVDRDMFSPELDEQPEDPNEEEEGQ